MPSKLQEEIKSHLVPDLGGEDDIVDSLSRYFGRKKKEVISPSRRMDLVQVRDLITYLLRKYGDMSYPAIGRLIGGRDHSTIIHSFQKTSKKVEEQPELAAELASIIGKVKEIRERKLQVEKELIPGILVSTHIEHTARPKEIPERNMKILELWREGLTLANIGNVMTITRERVRQIVVATVKQIAINESFSKGIVMDGKILAEEESKMRKRVQQSKKGPIKVPPIKEMRWSRYYSACRECGTTSIPHLRKGLCEQCNGNFRGDRREKIIDEHSNKCDSCDKTRYEASALFGRDFYITKDKQVFCRECFAKRTGHILGSYKRSNE